MATDLEVIQLDNEKKLILDKARKSQSNTCFNCRTGGSCTWFLLMKIILDEEALLPVCDTCVDRLQRYRVDQALGLAPGAKIAGTRVMDLGEVKLTQK